MDLVEAYPETEHVDSAPSIVGRKANKSPTSKPFRQLLEKTVRSWSKKEKLLWVGYLVKRLIERPHDNL
jgi:hypothetical protein